MWPIYFPRDSCVEPSGRRTMTPYAAGPGFPRAAPSIFAVYAPSARADGASGSSNNFPDALCVGLVMGIHYSELPKRTFLIFTGGSDWRISNGDCGGCGSGCRAGSRRVIGIVEDPRARLAMEESFIAVALQLLDHVRPDMDAALAAAFAANFSQGDAAMPLGDALVVVD